MAIDRLAKEFGKDLAFCGSMCTDFLPFGTVDDVKREVDRSSSSFPMEADLGPSHASK